MRITIHQPEHLPWLGFFHKMSGADRFVLLDNVQFSKNYFQNRNKARTADGWTWLTVPVSRTIDTLIKDVTISDDFRWKRKWKDTICYAYKKAPYFDKYFESIDNVMSNSSNNLCDFNVALIKCLAGSLNITTDLIMASELNSKGSGSDLILSICKEVGSSSYVSGISGRNYLKLDEFETAGIDVEFQEFHHPVYKQLYGPFIPCMSVIDLLFNCGDKSLDIIKGIGVQVMEEVFH
ncbi:MAG: WbqC family protein [Nitrospirae bacterium]|nr:WbqC family protein [Nitrospirota bacterium]